MKKFLFLLLLVLSNFPMQAQVPFHKGVNLTEWFQASSPRQIHFSKFTRKDFENIKSLGCDVIRLPVNLHYMTNGAPDYVVDPLFFSFLDEAVNWAEELNLYLIIDNHSFDPTVNTEPAVEEKLVKIWPQVAARYKERSDYIMYEVLNEPHGIDDAIWGAIQQSAINAIRTADNKHFIVVGGANFNNYNNLTPLPVYSDPKLIYTFHFYDPFLFTHQGATWVTPSMINLKNMPFPYKASSMPQLPSELKGSWIEGAFNYYYNDGTVNRIKELIDIVVNFKNSRKVPVFCGEFGVYIPNSNNTDRVSWYTATRSYLNEKGIPWTMWDYTGGFGLFEKDSYDDFDYDLNVPLLQALEFTVPPQKERVKKPTTSGFIIHDDYIGKGIVSYNNINKGSLDFYNTDVPEAKKYFVRFEGTNQYDYIGFNFGPDLDLSLLPSHNYRLSFWVKGTPTFASFDMRFIDTKASESDHPWRLGKTIDNTIVPFDNQWHEVSIPLKDLEEKGSWDNRWFDPQAQFDWSAVDKFEIVAEHSALTGIEFFFAGIKLVGEDIPVVLGVSGEPAIFGFNVYPNPSQKFSIIEFATSNPTTTKIEIFSQTGVKLLSIPNKNIRQGPQTFTWLHRDEDGREAAPGIYFVRLFSGTNSQVKKLILTN